MASKVQVATFRDFNESPRPNVLDQSSEDWDMEENEVVGKLKDDSFNKRVEILEQLIATVKRNGGRLPYHDHEAIFRGLGLALSDSNWDIRNKCISLLHELIPSLKDNLDHCMSLVLSKLISNIGDSKVTLRRSVIQSLHRYMKHTQNVPALLHAIVHSGLENEDARVRRETIIALPLILTKEFAHENLYGIIQSLAKKLLDTSAEDNLKDVSLGTLESIEKLVGNEQFDGYIHKLSPSLRIYYQEQTGKHDHFSPRENMDQSGFYSSRQSLVHGGLDRRDLNMESLQFGIVPTHIMNRINDQQDFKTRAQAVEDLKGVIVDLSASEINQKLIPHMMPFMGFLSTLLDDSNFKIITVTLEILYSVVEKLDGNVKNYVKNIATALSKRMGSNKVVIRQSIMRVLMKMMHCYSPQMVLSVMFDNLTHRNSRVRQEIINFIIAALLTFPSYEFDFPTICEVVGPTLTDVKRQVRQAALECFAVLAQAMGSGRCQPLVQAVDQVELNSDGEGLMAAVQARLARRQLPRFNIEGLVEYATPTPTSATQRSASSGQSADTEWILAVGGGSARTMRGSDLMEQELWPSSSARSTPGVSDYGAPTHAGPRRFMSAGRGRNKLPWEDDVRPSRHDEIPSSAPAHNLETEITAPKPRTMWIPDGDGGSPDSRNSSKRKTGLESLGFKLEDEDSPGSYSKIYNQKRRQFPSNSRTNSFNGTLDLTDFGRDTKENGYPRPEPRTSHTLLGPISADSARLDEFNKDHDESPIPLKATLARGSSTHRSTAKVPPIPTDRGAIEDDADSAYIASTPASATRTDTLQTIRRSARQKVDRLFQKEESRQGLAPSSPTASDQLQESGIFSTGSTFPSSRRRGEGAGYNKAGLNHKRSNSDTLDINENRPAVHLDYNPNSGVTFRHNRTSDVKVVGRGYADDSNSIDSRPYQLPKPGPRDRRRHTKASNTLLLTMGSPGLLSPLPFEGDKGGEEEKAKPSSQDRITLRGRGMFESPVNTEYPVSLSGMAEKGERRRMETVSGGAPTGVVGVAVRSTADMGSLDGDSTTTTAEDDIEDDNVSLSKSMSFKRKIEDKQRQKKEHEEQIKLERENEQRQREKEEKLRQERERQQQRLKKLGSNDSLDFEALSISGSGSNSSSASNIGFKGIPPRPTAPVVTPRRSIKQANDPISSHPMPVERPPPESESPAEELKPFQDPDNALKAASKKLESDDWEMKTEGLSMIRRLVLFHSYMFTPPVLHSAILLVVQEVKNLRSQVSRMAIACLGDMFSSLKKAMDTDLELATKPLLAKAGESNNFIRDDVDQALRCMVDGVTPQRSLLALVNGGASHKNTAVRRTTAQFLVRLVERMGSGKILSGIKDVTDRLLPTAAQFVMDSSQETRYYGRKILWLLMSHQDFERMLAKYLPPNTVRGMHDVLENLKMKGLGDKPNEISSARSRRSGYGSRMSSSIRGASAHSNIEATPISTPPVRRRIVRTDDATMEEIKTMIEQLSASDWKTRYDAIETFEMLCSDRREVVAVHIVKIFDKYLPRLQDSNSKVNLHALRKMQLVVPLLKDSLQAVITLCVQAVVPNLSSKNSDIRNTATHILDSFMEHLDHSILIQPFCNQAQNATGYSKSEMVLKVAHLTDRMYDRKPKQIMLHVLPLLWHLLNSVGTGAGELRKATGQLASTLYDHMGQALLDKASSDPGMTPRHRILLNELL